MKEVNFKALGLADPILRALADRHHQIPTEIQVQAIPALLDGRDVLGISQTGTGKTGAFALPLIQHIAFGHTQRAKKSPLALILAPTRELAVQINDEFRKYAKELPLRQTMVFGGVNQGPQVKGLARGVDLVIATPGRLVDLMNQRHVSLSQVRYLVLDEADRMLDMGFAKDLKRITDSLPEERQSLLFSATMPIDIAKLAEELLTDPVRVEVAPQSTPIERITQQVHHVEAGTKVDLLADLLRDQNTTRSIVFVRTKHGADRVAQKLVKQDIDADAIHGNKSQAARQRALKQFRAGKLSVLVATDIAARGIDVDGVSHVFNFELPNEPESYVHRIGRTARAGAEGTAISLCDPSEFGYLRAIEKLIGFKIEPVGDEPEGKPRKPKKFRRNGWQKRSQSGGHQRPANDAKRPHRHKRRAA